MMLLTPIIALATTKNTSLTVVTPKVVGASLFKNGYAVVTREIDVPAGGEVQIGQLPSAVYGSLWFSTFDNLMIESITSTYIDKKTVQRAPSFAAILFLNVGKTLTLDLAHEKVTGKLISFTGDSFVMRTSKGDRIILGSQVTGVSSNQKLKLDQTVSQGKDPVVRIVMNQKAKTKVFMTDLEPGLSWSPSYLFDVTDPKRMKIIEKAVISDDAARIDHLMLKLVTGFPNVKFLNTTDPMVLQQFIANNNMAYYGAPGGIGGQMSNGFGGGGGMGGGGFGRMEEAKMAPPPGSAMGTTGEGEQNEDLFFYKLPNVDLQKGDRGYYEVLTATLDYSDLYTWDLPDPVQNNTTYNYRPNPGGPDQAGRDVVWHSVKFTNTTGQPLTTGSVETYKKGDLLGQDEVLYTPKNSEAIVKITQALDLVPDSTESEIDRQHNVLNPNSYPHFDLVTLQATLQLSSHKSEDTEVVVTRPFTGEIVDAAGGTVTHNAKGLRDINPTGVISWTVKVPANTTQTITFKYKLYVQSPN